MSLTAITLEINLYSRLHKEMGLKSAKEEGLSFLGISARKVEFRERGIKPDNLGESTTDNNSCPRRSKKCR